MPVIIDKTVPYTPGSQTFVDSVAEGGQLFVVLEDNGETGYFYACEFSGPKREQKILDAVHIYNVANVVDRGIESECKIGWSPDGQVAVVMINQHPHAVADFRRKRLFSRTDFPKASGEWSREGHQWSDDALAPFR